jgi:hypothetical protein
LLCRIYGPGKVNEREGPISYACSNKLSWLCCGLMFLTSVAVCITGVSQT